MIRWDTAALAAALALFAAGAVTAAHAQSADGLPPGLTDAPPELPPGAEPLTGPPDFLKDRPPVPRSRDRSAAEAEAAAAKDLPAQCTMVLRPNWGVMRTSKAAFGRALNSMMVEARQEAADQTPALYYFEDSGTILLATPGDCERSAETMAFVTSRLQDKLEEPLRVLPPEASVEVPRKGAPGEKPENAAASGAR